MPYNSNSKNRQVKRAAKATSDLRKRLSSVAPIEHAENVHRTMPRDGVKGDQVELDDSNVVAGPLARPADESQAAKRDRELIQDLIRNVRASRRKAMDKVKLKTQGKLRSGDDLLANLELAAELMKSDPFARNTEIAKGLKDIVKIASDVMETSELADRVTAVRRQLAGVDAEAND